MSERHSVWGRVTDPDGRAVGTAEIFWVDATHSGKATVGLFDVHKVAQADVEGRFWAPNLPPGPGILVADFQRLCVVGDQVQIAHGTHIHLPADQELVLSSPHARTDFGRIVGVVTDEIDRRPVSRTPVALFVDGETKPLRRAETTTGGKFEFAWLRAGRYRVAVWGSVRQLEGSAPFDLKQNGRLDAQIQLFRRPPGPRTTVRVRVTDTIANPLRGAQVRVVVPSIHVAPGTTDADGRVEFGGLPAPPEQVLATAIGHWRGGVRILNTDDPIDAEISLEPSARVRVEVLDAATGKPLRHANLFASHGGGDQWVGGGVLPPPDAAPADHRDIEVLPGSVTVRASGPGFESNEVRLDVAAHEHTPTIVLRLGERAPG